MTTNEQLELGFNGLQLRAPEPKQADRMARAAWWFAQMRRMVAEAMEWPAAGQQNAGRNWQTDNLVK
jgi:hypothetical protein